MSDLDTHQRHGAHRARSNPWRAVLPSLLAVASVVSLVVALSVWRSQTDDGGSPAAFDGGATSSATTDAVSPSPSPSTSASTSATTDSTTSAPATTSTAGKTIGVVVLNQSGRRGLGATVAATLRQAGWTVAAVGNFHGAVPTTTVYYPEGKAVEASALAADLPGPDRTRPRFGNLSKTRLTVVLTSSYPG
jgi:LytR cell envelope-related transcriptional attenuator